MYSWVVVFIYVSGYTMNVKIYGFIIKAPWYKFNKTELDPENFSSTIIAISSMEDAYFAVDMLLEIGVDLIELCWWFEKDWYKKIKTYLNGRVPVWFVVFDK